MAANTKALNAHNGTVDFEVQILMSSVHVDEVCTHIQRPGPASSGGYFGRCEHLLFKLCCANFTYDDSESS